MGGEAENIDVENQEELEVDGAEAAPAENELENEVDVVDLSEKDDEGEEEPALKKRNPIKDMRERIRDQNKELKAHRRETRETKEYVETLEKKLADINGGAAPSGGEPEVGAAPTLESCGYDQDAYQQQMLAWSRKQTTEVVQQSFQERESQAAQDAKSQEVDQKITGHYDRANKLAVGDFESAEDKAAEVLGADLVQGIQATADNSELVVYYLGKNPDKARELREIFDRSPGEFTFKLGKMAANLSLKPRSSNAPDPDIPVPGGGGVIATAKERQWMRKLDEAYDKQDINLARQVRREAEANGVKLPYNQA